MILESDKIIFTLKEQTDGTVDRLKAKAAELNLPVTFVHEEDGEGRLQFVALGTQQELTALLS